LTLLAHGLATSLYLFAAFLGWTRRSTGRNPRAVSFVIAFAAVVQASGFYGLHLQDPPVPLSSFPAALSLIGWLIALIWFAAPRALHLRDAGPWVAFLALVFTLPAELGLQLSAPREAAPGGLAWSHAHVLLGAAGFGLLALSSLAGLGYLAKERALKRRLGFARSLPPLEALDRAEHVTLLFGFALLTLGVATGFAWGVREGIDPWTHHTIFLLVAWAIFLMPVGARIVRQQQGAWPARGVLACFAFLAFSYIGIRLLGAGA
jgi:ABC-type uncharacterized transport system permease subunit